MERIIGVDYGDVRTGLAVSDTSGLISSPIGFITETDAVILAEKITEKANIYNSSKIVLGLPKNMNGTEGDRAIKTRALAEILEKDHGKTVILWDERCTTIRAHNILNQTDTRGKKRKAAVDTLSAAIMLQEYLDFIKL